MNYENVSPEEVIFSSDRKKTHSNQALILLNFTIAWDCFEINTSEVGHSFSVWRHNDPM